MTASDKAEDRFIQRYFAPLADDSGALGLQDDAAQIAVPEGMSLVVSTDTIIAGIHFFDCDPPASIARKALRVNMSDLIAKGSQPKGYFLSLAVPERLLRSDEWMSAFVGALAQDQQALDIRLLGGDTVMTPDVSAITICAYGLVPNGRMVTRSGAETGDSLFVTGTIGDSAVGLWARKATVLGLDALSDVERQILAKLSPQECNQLEQAYLKPPVNLAASGLVLEFATASMDVSDGLSGDAATLAGASNCGLDIRLDAIPHHPGLTPYLDEHDLRARLVSGGDDYQVLCTVPQSRCKAFEMEMAKAMVPVCCIGSVVDKPGVRFLDRNGQDGSVAARAFDHFS